MHCGKGTRIIYFYIPLLIPITLPHYTLLQNVELYL